MLYYSYDKRNLIVRAWRPHTTGILIGGIVLILVATVASYVIVHFQPSVEVHVGSAAFNVKVAATKDAREAGLAGVTELSPNEGMLMVFDSDGLWGIWMKDMKVPIDIIWLDNQKKVVHIVTDASPELSTTKTFTPQTAARYVLELPAGSVKNAAIKIGGPASFTLGGQQ